MSGIQCKCGRFLGRPYVQSAAEGEGYGWHEFVSDVRGDCSRCGPDVPAAPGPWWDWDNWDWKEAPAVPSGGEASGTAGKAAS